MSWPARASSTAIAAEDLPHPSFLERGGTRVLRARGTRPDHVEVELRRVAIGEARGREVGGRLARATASAVDREARRNPQNITAIPARSETENSGSLPSAANVGAEPGDDGGAERDQQRADEPVLQLGPAAHPPRRPERAADEDQVGRDRDQLRADDGRGCRHRTRACPRAAVGRARAHRTRPRARPRSRTRPGTPGPRRAPASTVRLRISSWSSPAARNGTFSTAPNSQYTSNASRLQPFSAPIATASDATRVHQQRDRPEQLVGPASLDELLRSRSTANTNATAAATRGNTHMAGRISVALARAPGPPPTMRRDAFPRYPVLVGRVLRPAAVADVPICWPRPGYEGAEVMVTKDPASQDPRPDACPRRRARPDDRRDPRARACCSRAGCGARTRSARSSARSRSPRRRDPARGRPPAVPLATIVPPLARGSPPRPRWRRPA